MSKHIGRLTDGSIKDGFQVRLEVQPKEVQEGAFVVVEGKDYLFSGGADSILFMRIFMTTSP